MRLSAFFAKIIPDSGESYLYLPYKPGIICLELNKQQSGKPVAANDRKGKGSVMFSIGERVVHPIHGAGVIDDIVQERISGTVREYYVFKAPSNGLVLKIPVANVTAVGIRPIMTHDEVECLFAKIPLLEAEANSNWSKRYQENVSRLKSGDLCEVIRVIKSLMYRANHRALSTGEWKMLHTAKQIIISEIALVEGCTSQEVETRLDVAVMQKNALG